MFRVAADTLTVVAMLRNGDFDPRPRERGLFDGAREDKFKRARGFPFSPAKRFSGFSPTVPRLPLRTIKLHGDTISRLATPPGAGGVAFFDQILIRASQ